MVKNTGKEKKPKRPLSNYMYYSTMRRAVLKMQSPDIRMVDLSKMIAQEWSELSAEAKQPYVDLALLAKQNYEKKSN